MPESSGTLQEIISVDLQKIESEALHLAREDRVRLVQKLVLSLDAPSSEEVKADWLSEARRRAAELDEGAVVPVPAEDVMRRARDLIK